MTSKETAPSSARRQRLCHLACVLLLAGLSLPVYHVFLSGDRGALGRDFGTIFLSKMQQQVDALHCGRLLLWDPILYGGTAFWPLPNTAPAYPPLLLSFLLRGSALGGLNLAVLLHVIFGAVGIYVLVYHLGRRCFAALFGGLLFIYARFTQQQAFILPLDLMALAWVPWTLCFLVKGMGGGTLIRSAAAAGLCYSAVTWAGGYQVFLYGLVAAGIVVFCGSVQKPLIRNLSHGAALLAVFLAIFLILSAGKLWPTGEWLSLTSRAEPLPFDVAAREVFDPIRMESFLLEKGWIALALTAAALVVGIVRGIKGRFDWALAFLLAVAVTALLSSGIVYHFLYDYVPGFSRIRNPRLAWILMPALFPVPAALALALCQSWIRLRGRMAVAGGAVFLALAGIDYWTSSEYRRPRLFSLSERLQANAIHQDLARRAREETRFRVHDYADTRAYVKKSADLIRSALRLESLEANLGNISIHAYDRDYFAASGVDPARLWGLMNCRYVTSGKRLEEPGLECVAEFEEDPRELKADSDGPFLYRNLLEMPRAYRVDHAVLLVIDDPEKWHEWLTMVYSRMWNPRTTVLIKTDAGRLRGLEPEVLGRFDAILSFREAGLDQDLVGRISAAGVPLLDAGTAGGKRKASIECGEILSSATEACRPLPDPQPEWNRARYHLAGEGGGRWLVLAETFSIYPGWTAEVDGEPAPVFIANGAATAVPVSDEAREVHLRYAPPGCYPGLAISLTGLAFCVFLVRRKKISV